MTALKIQNSNVVRMDNTDHLEATYLCKRKRNATTGDNLLRRRGSFLNTALVFAQYYIK